MKKTRVAYIQAREALRKANPNRQYYNQADAKFQWKCGEIIDLFAMYVEVKMKVPSNSGRNCGVQPKHIDNCFSDIQTILTKEITEAVLKHLNKTEEEE
tara:strand:- start:98 stop:394 length:297 start_codon:yes stop_codon:yes gene_type:complete